jgi:catechol 2,3-dioxygenase-like lactoylglutathione lyase family enzyme
MSIGPARIHHVQITIPRELEDSTKRFYARDLGLEEIAKPEESRGRGGAWFRAGALELHVGVEAVERAENQRSKRHVCLLVDDLARAESALRAAGIEIIPDDNPVEGWSRFYVRDPAGNRVEIAATP